MTDTNSDVEPEKESKPIIIRNTTDLQRLKLEKLMKNPEKPVIIPEKPKERGVPVVPDFVRNVMGSSAGAGSGEFHVYRHLRRKEYARQKYMKEKGERERLDNEYHQKLEENRKRAEERTAKKRQKRLKKKQKQNKQYKKPKTSNQSQSDSSDNSTSDSESAKETQSDQTGDTFIKKDIKEKKLDGNETPEKLTDDKEEDSGVTNKKEYCGEIENEAVDKVDGTTNIHKDNENDNEIQKPEVVVDSDDKTNHHLPQEMLNKTDHSCIENSSLENGGK